MITNFLCDYVCETVRGIEQKNSASSNIITSTNTGNKTENTTNTSAISTNTIPAHFAQSALQCRANDEHIKDIGMCSKPTISVDGARFDDL